MQIRRLPRRGTRDPTAPGTTFPGAVLLSTAHRLTPRKLLQNDSASHNKTALQSLLSLGFGALDPPHTLPHPVSHDDNKHCRHDRSSVASFVQFLTHPFTQHFQPHTPLFVAHCVICYKPSGKLRKRRRRSVRKYETVDFDRSSCYTLLNTRATCWVKGLGRGVTLWNYS